jgi:agmatine deiminase
VVIVPTFNDRNDRVALNTLAELMPDREVVGVHAVDLVWGLGTLHCLTQQQARG